MLYDELILENNNSILGYENIDENGKIFHVNDFDNLILEKENLSLARFKLKFEELFPELPINTYIKYDKDLMIKAIELGMIMNVRYRGETGASKDNFKGGKERLVYPMTLGTSGKGKPLLRVWHFKGWSVSSKGFVQKIWRLFRTDRVLKMAFSGYFYVLPPTDYNPEDKGMRGGILKSANFDQIRNAQKKLMTELKISEVKPVLSKDVIVRDLSSTLNLKQPFRNYYVKDTPMEQLNLTFLKNTASGSNEMIAILDMFIDEKSKLKIGDTLSIKKDNNANVGKYDIVSSYKGNEIGVGKVDKVNEINQFKLYRYIK